MKITKLYLKNFSRIKSAMGVDEVTIDLSNDENLFLFLKGENGSGKSTLLNQLQPWRDSFDGNGSITYGEAVKEVTIQHENGDYLIRHQYGKVSKTFIYKNGEVLNSNGNVREAEELINKELGYTPEFLELSRISSSMSSFVDKKSTDRKKFITSLMPSIDFYVKLFDKVKTKISEENKKLRSVEAEMSKLDSFSEEELVAQKDNARRISETIEILSNDIAVAKSKLLETKKLLADMTYITDVALSDQRDKIDSFSNSLIKFIETYGKKSISLAKEELDLVKEDLMKVRFNITDFGTKLKNANDRVGLLKNSIISDKNLLLKMSEIDIDEIQKSITGYENIIKSIDTENTYYKYVVNKEVSINELMSLENFIQYTVNSKGILGKLYKEISSIGIINIQNKETELKNKLIPLGIDLKALETKVSEDSLHYREFINSKHGSDKHCSDPSCPYEKEVAEYEKLGTIIEDNIKKTKDLEKQISSIREDIDENSLVKSKAEEWLILKKKYSTSTFNTFSKHYDLYESDDLITDYNRFYKDVSKAFEESSMLVSTTKNLADAKKSLEESKDKISLVNNITLKIQEQEKEQNKLEEEIVSLNFDIKQNKDKEIELTKKSLMYNDFITAKENLQLALEEKTQMEENQLKWNDTNKDITEKGEEIAKLIAEKSKQDSELSVVNLRVKQLERLKINKELLEESLKAIKDNLDMYTPISNALDTKKGIPVIFQKVYLKQTAFLANKLLKVAYGEKFEIDFELTDNDFFIRVTDSEGNIREDARSLSDGEKSVVGLSLSLALIEQTGNRDKILYLDEADGVLDSKNRRSFINILENQLVLLGIEQCIIISHNDSFKDISADVILLRDNDSEPDHIEKNIAFLENKKVIFDYKKILE